MLTNRVDSNSSLPKFRAKMFHNVVVKVLDMIIYYKFLQGIFKQVVV